MLSPKLLGSTPRPVRRDASQLLRRDAFSLTWADESWTDLLQALFSLSMSQDAGKREIAFRVFTTTPGIIEQHGDTVATAFARGFKDDSVAVRALSCPDPGVSGNTH